MIIIININIVTIIIIINGLFIEEKKDFSFFPFIVLVFFPHFQYKTVYCKLYFLKKIKWNSKGP